MPAIPVGIPVADGAAWRSPAASPSPPPDGRRRSCPASAAARVAAAGCSGAFSPERRHMFVFGTGFVGRYVAERLLLDGWFVSGTCTNTAKKKELEKIGMGAYIFEAKFHKLVHLHALQNATHLLISIPPLLGVGDPLLSLHEDLHMTLNNGGIQWLSYLSSTSVYGDCGGAWVDEDHSVNPQSESAKLRYEAERGWLSLGEDLGSSVFVFRLGGIYGPGRSALDTLLKNSSISESQKLREFKQYTSRVHVADIYQAIKSSLSISPSKSSKIYNLVDDDPAPRSKVFPFARSLITERFPAMAGELTTDAGAYVDAEPNIGRGKRVCNSRIKRELRMKLLYPTYEYGLESIADSWLPVSVQENNKRRT